MTTYEELPAEMKLAIFEVCHDFRSLLCLVHSCASNQELFKEHAKAIIEAVIKNVQCGKLMQDLYEEYHKEDKPEEESIWQQHDHFRKLPFTILRDFADMEHKVEEMTSWCTEHQAETSLDWIAQGHRKLTTDEVRQTLWKLRLQAQRMSDLEAPLSVWFEDLKSGTGGPAANASNDQQGLDGLKQMYVVLFTLTKGYNKLIRHQLYPRLDSTMALFFTQENKDQINGYYGYGMYGRICLQARCGDRPGHSYENTVQLLQCAALRRGRWNPTPGERLCIENFYQWLMNPCKFDRRFADSFDTDDSDTDDSVTPNLLHKVVGKLSEGLRANWDLSDPRAVARRISQIAGGCGSCFGKATAEDREAYRRHLEASGREYRGYLDDLRPLLELGFREEGKAKLLPEADWMMDIRMSVQKGIEYLAD